MKNFLLISLLVPLFTACSESNLPEFNRITTPRIIGIIADKPEANPGDTINITPVISDLAALTPVQDTLQVCVDLGIAFGASPTCEGNPTKVVVHNHRFLGAPGLLENWTGLADPASFVIPVDAVIFYQRSAQDKFNGVNYLVEYTMHSSSGVNISSIKRIVVTEAAKVAKNINPTFTDIFANGVSMTTLPVGESKVALTSDLANTSAESYLLKDDQGALKNYGEELTVTWFITDGITKYFRSLVGESNEYTGPMTAPTGRSAYILAVARDSRGGMAVIKRKLN